MGVVCVMRGKPDSVLENIISRVYHGDMIDEAIHNPSGSQMNPGVPHVSLLLRKVILLLSTRKSYFIFSRY